MRQTRTYQFFFTTLRWALAALLVASGVLVAAPATAAPDTPTGLTADASIIPTLTWDHVPGATHYVVEISKAPDVAQRIGTAMTTLNRHFVPTQPLPWSPDTLVLYWRVAASDSVQGGFSSWMPINRSAGYAAPVITSPPAQGKTFTQPGDPATLTWEPVAGAQEYEVEISPDSSFTDPTLKTIARTIAPTHVVSTPQVDTTYWFKVRARLSSSLTGAVYSDYSAARSYSVSALPPAVRVAPANDATVVDDAILDWNPILGARTYDLQVATDPSFGSIVHAATNVTGTSYARPQSLNNDQYYWRVRARDIADNVPTWGSRPTWRFERDWPDLPMPRYPAAPADIDPAHPSDSDTGVTVGDPFYYEWEPVRFASMYKIELSSDAGFSTIVGVCYTRSTTYTPASEDLGRCMPEAEKTYWWRLTAMDQYRSTGWDTSLPITSQNVFHDARFTYSPARVTQIAPSDNATVTVPTMTWAPLAGAARYKVSWKSVGLGVASSAFTAATSFTPPSLPAGQYQWQVVGVTSTGREGAPLLFGERRFTLDEQEPATASAPTVTSPLSGSYARFPLLKWTPVAEAQRYRVRVRVAGGSGWAAVAPTFDYPAGTDPSSLHLAPGEYEWTVDALNAAGAVTSTSPTTGLFEIKSPALVTGQTNALSMAASKAGESCTGFECTDLRETPLLRWDPAPNTGYYKIWISRNQSFSNPVPAAQLGKATNPFPVSGTAWTPTTVLQDSNAGEAYFWAVQPCTNDDKCAATPIPVNSFNKVSNAVATDGPGAVVVNGVPQGGATIPTVSDDVTLKWHDFLDTNTTASQGSSSLPTRSTQTGREYEVQVATDHTFNNLLDSQYVDQRRYTSFNNTYPEGNIYWHVRAFDPSGNPLPWSPTLVVNKQSPSPVLNAVAIQGPTPTFSWQPLNFAASYELEIYPQASNTPKVVATSNQVKWSASTSAQSLAPGQYEWQVRRKDAKSRFGGWSGRQPLTISESTTTLNAPIANGSVAPRDSVFSWAAHSGASEYRLILTSPTGVQTIQVTKATAWSPTARLVSGTWSWRVEPRDTAGVAMGTSASQAFQVTTELAASQPARVEGSGQVDSVLTGYAPVWTESPDTVTYQWYRGGSPVGDATLSYTVTVADLGQKISLRATAAKGGHVNAISNSNAITTAPGAAPVATTPPTITGSGAVGDTLTGNPPAWAQPDVTNTYRWLVNGASVGTAQTFVVRIGDIGKDITFEVTGRRVNYVNAIVTSAPITARPGGALQPTVQPVISGTKVYGGTLSVSAGSWSQLSPSLRYQWLRAGAPIPNANAATYKLTTDDAGKDIGVTVLATKAGFADGASSAAAVGIAKLTSATVATLAATRVKPGKRVKVGIAVAVPGVTGPTGVLKIFDGAKALKTLTLVSARNGKLAWKLPKLKKGKHKIKVVYLGNGNTAGSKSKVVKLFVVKKAKGGK